MYFCPLCNTRYTAEQPCFCHPGAQANSPQGPSELDSLHVELLTIEGMLRNRNLQ
jgi:hypothetical protein